MNYKTKKRIKEGIEDFKQWIYQNFIKPVKKWKRRRDFVKRQRAMRLAKVELIENFDRFIMRLLDESINEYQNTKQRNFHTIQAMYDIREIHKEVIKGYITSTK